MPTKIPFSGSFDGVIDLGFGMSYRYNISLCLQIQWRALDEINVGVCDGMTYEEVKKNMPEEYKYVITLYMSCILRECNCKLQAAY